VRTSTVVNCFNWKFSFLQTNFCKKFNSSIHPPPFLNITKFLFKPKQEDPYHGTCSGCSHHMIAERPTF